MKPRLALFDLDNTLLAGDSDYAWAEFLIEEGVIEERDYNAKNDYFYARYKDGTLDIHEFLDFQLKPISGVPRAQLDAWHAKFMENKIRPIILPGALELLARHTDALRAIVTATNSFVTAPIAAALGVTNLIATDIEEADGMYVCRARGTPCFQEGKIERVGQWLASRGRRLEDFESWFYSDSRNDLPLLERVDHPVAVDPDPVLAQEAKRRGWPVMSLR
jgi:HAD superfamily hydrolase (TIGR01490 family)